MELKKKLMAAKIISHEEITPVVKKMVLLAPEIASEVQPGQFVMVRPEQSRYFLRRPISVADADLEAGTFTLIYRMVGGGDLGDGRTCGRRYLERRRAAGTGIFFV
jgi:dihydroorotate dehydrogenase electron transfer subunit